MLTSVSTCYLRECVLARNLGQGGSLFFSRGAPRGSQETQRGFQDAPTGFQEAPHKLSGRFYKASTMLLRNVKEFQNASSFGGCGFLASWILHLSKLFQAFPSLSKPESIQHSKHPSIQASKPPSGLGGNREAK